MGAPLFIAVLYGWSSANQFSIKSPANNPATNPPAKLNPPVKGANNNPKPTAEPTLPTNAPPLILKSGSAKLPVICNAFTKLPDKDNFNPRTGTVAKDICIVSLPKSKLPANRTFIAVETELGVLAGIEDERTFTKKQSYTNPEIVADFVKQTQTDSLAIAIGTSHGLYKRKNENEKLRFDILKQIATNIPKIPLVLHGASTIPQKFITKINKFGGDISFARGISPAQLRQAITLHITKINIDSDSRLAFTSSIRETLAKYPNIINPREYLTTAMNAMTQNCIDEIKNIMGSSNKA